VEYPGRKVLNLTPALIGLTPSFPLSQERGGRNNTLKNSVLKSLPLGGGI